MQKQLSPEALHILEQKVELVQNPPEKRWELYLGQNLPRPIYEELKQAFLRLDGKWNRKSGAIVFPLSRPIDEMLAAMIEAKKMPEKNPLQFFGTPENIADQMIDLAFPDPALLEKETTHILEPCAGQGSILQSLRNINFKGFVTAVEIDDYNCEVMRSSLDFDGDVWRLYNSDYFLWAGPDEHRQPEYNVILLNPPFKTKGKPQWFVHWFLYCLERLENGGRMVCVVPNGVFTSTHKDCKTFRRIVKNNVWGRKELPFQAFKESGTNVQTSLVSIHKQWGSPRDWNPVYWEAKEAGNTQAMKESMGMEHPPAYEKHPE